MRKYIPDMITGLRIAGAAVQELWINITSGSTGSQEV